MAATLKQLAHSAITAAAGATTLYTAPALTRTLLTKASVHNQGTVAATFDVHIVPSGGTANADNRLLSACPIAAGDTLMLDEVKGVMLAAAGFVVVRSYTATLNYLLNGTELT